MTKHIYGLMDSETGRILFEYKTNQGNRKKAIFSSEKQAIKAIESYLKYDGSNYYPNREASKRTWVLIVLGKRFETI